MNVNSVCNHGVATIGAKTGVIEAAARMRAEHVGDLIVTEHRAGHIAARGIVMRTALTFIALSAFAFVCAAQGPVPTPTAPQAQARSHSHAEGTPQPRACAAPDSECRLERMHDQMDAMSERLANMQTMMEQMMGRTSGHMMRGKPSGAGHDRAKADTSMHGCRKEDDAATEQPGSAPEPDAAHADHEAHR